MAKAPYHRGEELFVVLNITKGIPFAFFAFFTSLKQAGLIAFLIILVFEIISRSRYTLCPVIIGI